MSSSADPRLRPPRLAVRNLLYAAFVGLRARRLRSALLALGIAIGIAAMVAVMGVSASSRADLLAQIDRLGTNLLPVLPGQSFLGEESVLPETATAMARRIRGLTGTSAVRSRTDATVRRSPYVRGITVTAVDTRLTQKLRARLRHGRSRMSAGSASRSSCSAPRRHGGSGSSESASASGSTTPGGRWSACSSRPPSRRGSTTPSWSASPPPGAPRSRGQPVDHPRARRPRARESGARPAPCDGEPPAARGGRGVASLGGPRSPGGGRDGADVAAPRPRRGRAAGRRRGIANVMVVAVLERRGEIGLRRALGARRRHVAQQFLAEAVVLAGTGGAAGAALGAAVTAAYAAAQRWTLAVPEVAIAGGFGPRCSSAPSWGCIPPSARRDWRPPKPCAACRGAVVRRRQRCPGAAGPSRTRPTAASAACRCRR